MSWKSRSFLLLFYNNCNLEYKKAYENIFRCFFMKGDSYETNLK